MHIINLYHKDGQDILLFKECYALEKVHGTSAHITWKAPLTIDDKPTLVFFSGGTKHETFVSIFDQEALMKGFTAIGILDKDITIFGESYGGKEQGMGQTYGTVGKFVAFDVQIGDKFLDVPKAEKVVKDLGLEFVYYTKVSTDLVSLDAERDAPSYQAIRNKVSGWFDQDTLIDTTGPIVSAFNGHVTNPKIREGVVLRPLIELTKNNGERIMCKHKRDEFRETKSPRPVVDPEKQKLISEAQDVADEYVTKHRLEHILQKLPDHNIEKMREIIFAMVEDINREGSGEFIPSELVNKNIGKNTAILYKEYLKSNLYHKNV